MLNIRIKSIPHKSHRYATCGDYYDVGNRHEVRVSNMSDWRYEFLVAIHELIESHLCRHRGIVESAITDFDVWFEKARDMGLFDMDEEPGDDPRAPYMKEHRFATFVERLLAKELKVDWERYATEIERLP